MSGIFIVVLINGLHGSVAIFFKLWVLRLWYCNLTENVSVLVMKVLGA